MKLCWETQMKSVSEAKVDSTTPTVDTHIFTKPHLSSSEGLRFSRYSCVVLKSNKKTKDQNPKFIQCQTFTTWNEVIYFFLLATQKLALFSLTMTFKFASKKKLLILSSQVITWTQRSWLLCLCFQKHFHYWKNTTTLICIPLKVESTRK